MGRYNDFDDNQINRQRDLVLAVNEFCFLQSKTNGAIKTYTGPTTMTISQQESLVTFNSNTKKFEETTDFEKAKQLFVSAPEGWYIVLKNPTIDDSHPEAAKAMISPELKIGCKINIAGPASFSLFPGQMATVVKGHRLRSNQYLLARVYDADAAKKSIATATIVNTEGKEVSANTEEYFVGQSLIIKGTEVSFYIPPTGIKIVPQENGEYAREAITLERLEYAILKDEDGEKRYIHGPAVVFPKPTETFVETPDGKLIFRALELSPISGIYVKVIAEYDETKNGKKIHHPIGEELFITGKDQMIYYPRPEHALIQYDGKYMHHAIAIPEGEGRYILNRLTGQINMIRGPQMYLPDPRNEVVVKRKLTKKECQLMYPNNTEVLQYNSNLTEKAVEKLAKRGIANTSFDNLANLTYATSNQESTLAIFEANANISRGTSYTKPRTITLDTKYEGVVTVDVWTGYAINVIPKVGERKVIIGPATYLFNYDETIEAMELSCGTPKTDMTKKAIAFLNIENNKVSDQIYAKTKDKIDICVNISYYVNFLKEYKDKWFNINDYTMYLCNKMRLIIIKEIEKWNIKDFYMNSFNILRNIILGTDNKGKLFEDNGMLITDIKTDISIEGEILKTFKSYQKELITKDIVLSTAEARQVATKALIDAELKKAELEHNAKINTLKLAQEEKEKELEKEYSIEAKRREEEAAKVQAKQDLQETLEKIQEAELRREKEKLDLEITHQKELLAIEEAKQKSYAENMKTMMEAISPDLIAALNANSNAKLLESGMKNISPYAIANGESVPDTINKLLRGTSLENLINKK